MKREERLENLVMLAKCSAICAVVLTLQALSWVPSFRFIKKPGHAPAFCSLNP